MIKWAEVSVATLCILFFISFIGLITLASIDAENVKKDKVNFCDLKDMQFRVVGCGLGCDLDQCYSEAGAFELEKYGDGFILIGYTKILENPKGFKK